MIRFGKYEDAYCFKTDADPNKRLFPIPTVALATNPHLKENPGVLINLFSADNRISMQPRELYSRGILLKK